MCSLLSIFSMNRACDRLELTYLFSQRGLMCGRMAENCSGSEQSYGGEIKKSISHLDFMFCQAALYNPSI